MGEVEVATGKRTFGELVGVHDLHLVRLYRQCLDSWGALARWPDGGPVIDQPVKLTQAFNIIGATLHRYKKG